MTLTPKQQKKNKALEDLKLAALSYSAADRAYALACNFHTREERKAVLDSARDVLLKASSDYARALGKN